MFGSILILISIILFAFLRIVTENNLLALLVSYGLFGLQQVCPLELGDMPTTVFHKPSIVPSPSSKPFSPVPSKDRKILVGAEQLLAETESASR